MKQDDVKVVNIVVIDGERVDLSTLPIEKQKEIGRKINHDGLLSLGYQPVATEKTA